MQTVERGAVSSLTYAEVRERVARLAAVLADLGLHRGDRLALLSENCPEWAQLDWACQVLGLVLVPIYPTLPADQVAHIVRDSGSRLLVVGSTEQMKKAEALEGVNLAFLRQAPESLSARAEARPVGMSTERMRQEAGLADPENLATLIYTSGTTGTPKGVMLTHRNFLHVAQAASRAISLDESDVFLSFLPLSHVYERVAGHVLPVTIGACIGYAKSLMTLAGDLAAVRPTVLLCVPRFLEQTREKVLDGVAKGPPLRRYLFGLALSQGGRRARGQFAPLAGLLDRLVAGKVRARLGGRLRFLASGGGALAAHVGEFYRALGFTILQGYGLTESTGGTCLNRPERNDPTSVGEPLDMEVRLAEDGEILLRGPGLMKGYFNLPDETARTIDANGWLRTGDIGEFVGSSLKITDRKKDLMKLSNGKYVAPQPIENQLKASEWIAEAVVEADGRDFAVALIVPNFDRLRSLPGAPTQPPEMAEWETARAQVKAAVDAVNRGLPEWERVKRFALLPTGFSVDSGELTPTLKVKRKVVRERYAHVLAEL